MKRPQFSLRLLLLVVALLATVFAWMHAANRLKWESNGIERMHVQSRLTYLQQLKTKFADGTVPSVISDGLTASELDRMIDDADHELHALNVGRP